MSNLNYISKLLFGLEWSELDEEQKRTCVIWETCNEY
jgi:hypothetical protein